MSPVATPRSRERAYLEATYGDGNWHDYDVVRNDLLGIVDRIKAAQVGREIRESKGVVEGLVPDWVLGAKDIARKRLVAAVDNGGWERDGDRIRKARSVGAVRSDRVYRVRADGVDQCAMCQAQLPADARIDKLFCSASCRSANWRRRRS